MTAADALISLFRDLSVELLQMIDENEILLAKLCAFYPGSADEINQIHERVSDYEECLSQQSSPSLMI